MQRKVAYVFLYRNGIRERSVGIVRRYSTAEQPEVALELFGEEVRNRGWSIYYVTNKGALAEASYLWESTAERGRSEVRLVQCRLCAEAGMGEGIVLLPEELPSVTWKGNSTEPVKRAEQDRSVWIEKIRRGELREYLCARYDGKEVSPDELRAALCRKPEQEPGEDPRIESAKRLMEEITKAAGGVTANETVAPEDRKLLPEAVGDVEKGRDPGTDAGWKAREKKRRRRQSTYLEELLISNPPYVPCRRYEVEYSVRITPEELSGFFAEGKQFAENSFVLHGYYHYRHVLLGRRIGKEKEDYVLLVPGDYSEKQAGLAERFGFPEFFPVIKTNPETGIAASGKGLFGYWCGKI